MLCFSAKRNSFFKAEFSCFIIQYAWILNQIKLPKDAMLSRYADIIDGKYVQKEKSMPVRALVYL